VGGTVVVVLTRAILSDHSTIVSSPAVLVLNTMCANYGVGGENSDVLELDGLGQSSHKKHC